MHPESYHIVDAMAKDLGVKVDQLMQNEALRKQIELEKYKTDTVGMPTLKDIMAELAKPGATRARRSSFSNSTDR